MRVLIGEDFLDYDHVILAAHADQSLDLIKNPTDVEKNILGKFLYVSNNAVLHSDDNLMPKNKKTWSSWNSITKNDKTCVTYWLNKLQNLNTEINYFLTLNPVQEIMANKTIKKK